MYCYRAPCSFGRLAALYIPSGGYHGDRYLVEWRYNYKDPLTYIVADMYIITFSLIYSSTLPVDE